MSLSFEWDPSKARENARKYKVFFEEAATVFGDPFSLTISDPLHFSNEERFITVGQSISRRILVIVHTDRGSNIRIVSARLATRMERRNYEEKA